MFGEQQAIASYPTPNPNPLQTDPYASSYPYSHGFDGSEARPVNEVDAVGASRSGMISQTTDSTTYENASGTLNETTTVSTIMHSSGNFGVVTQHVVNDVTLATKESENVQNIECDVCHVTCNREDVLEKHKQGKKHLKNLQKLAISTVIAPKMPPPVTVGAPVVGELENKKHKLLQNGASVDSLIYCDICDVVCNNQDVFGKHLAGKKHFAKATLRLANMNGISNPTPDSNPGPTVAQPSNNGSPKKPDPVQPFRCDLCNISCTSNELLEKHLSGKKHMKKLKETEKIPDPSSTPMENTNSTEGKMFISQENKPVSCELCGITCNAYDVLKTHISGKKHQKNLEKSKIPIGPNLAPETEPPQAPQVIGPLQYSAGDEGKIVISDGNKRKSKRSAAKDEDLETKKQRVLECGADSGALRTCTVCNVICNSPAVFISHLAGQKHAAMAVKQAEAGSIGEGS